MNFFLNDEIKNNINDNIIRSYELVEENLKNYNKSEIKLLLSFLLTSLRRHLIKINNSIFVFTANRICENYHKLIEKTLKQIIINFNRQKDDIIKKHEVIFESLIDRQKQQ